jgi:UDP-GlcNAc:undecaprenyl-phosphate/decaprenyl-phosphate GlcNAc-1-phosphate transferase
MSNIMVYCVNAFLLSLTLILAMTKIASRIGLVDVPSSIKTHEGQIPMVGAALFLAFCGAAVLLQPQPSGLTSLLIGLFPIVALGMIDDLFDLGALAKLIGQCLCVSVLIFPAHLLIRSAGDLLGGQSFLLGHWAIPVTIFAMVGLVNAVNMIDGLDGLAGGISLIAFIWFGIAATLLGLTGDLSIILVLAFVVLGFLVFNFRHPWRARASMFLGDAGSMMLGLSLAYVAVELSQRGQNSMSPIAVLWVLAIPTIDTLSLMIRRVASGKGLLSSDRRHVHDLLQLAGLSANATTLVIVGISAVLGGIGVGGWYFGVSDRHLLVGLVPPVLLHTWFVTVGYKWVGTQHGTSRLNDAIPSRPVRMPAGARASLYTVGIARESARPLSDYF